MLSSYNLPSPMGMSKDEIVELLLKEEYGYLPSRPESVSATVLETNTAFCAGKGDLQKMSLLCKGDFGEFSFPFYYICPKEQSGKVPAFIHINFTDMVPDKYQPTEELIDAGYAVILFCYKDVTSDDGDFKNGFAGVLYPDGKRTPHSTGKIGMWAWAAMSLLDYAMTLPELDHDCISVVGHSRLGKTALLAGALDERFFCAISNDSGCSGASLSRENSGETVKKIIDRFPYWFCENYAKYCDNESSLPFDQHYLVAANLPHRVYVASAVGDWWACPKNEYLSCVAATPYYEANGKSGLIHPERLPEVAELMHEGFIAYHMRRGTHYLSREDWSYYIKYINLHRKG